MQTPDRHTAVSKCLELGAHAARMLGKFTDNPVLLTLSTRMTASADALEIAQDTYQRAVKDILPFRVDVKYENHISDRRIRVTQQKIEIADGKRAGPIATLVLPDGSSPITRLVGASQVAAMIDLEGRLAASAPFYPEAMAEKTAIEQHRLRYQAALDGRDNAGRRARDLRAVRDATKAQFLLDYSEIVSRVQAEFPRDRVMQDLFFDEVRSKSALSRTDADDSAPDTDAPAPDPSSQPAAAE